MKLEQINNAMFIANIAPMVQKFVERIEVPNVSYEAMVYLLQNRAQYGGNLSEVWIAYNDTEHLGWASWRVCDATLVSTVYLDYIYTKGNRKDISKAFAEQFTKFAEKNNAVWLTMDIVKSGKLLEHFKNIAKEIGFEIKVNPWFPCLATKVDFYKEKLKEK
jgi:hypothetical protein